MILRLRHFLYRLGADQSGVVALMFMVSAALIFGASLGAIDLIRYTDAKTRVQASLDNAVMAAGQLATTVGTGDLDVLQAEAQAYFEAGFPQGYLGSKMTGSEVSLALGEGGLVATFSGNLPLVSTGFLEVSSLGLASTSVVQLASVGDAEVVFALDAGDHSGHTSLNSAASTLAQSIMLEMAPDGSASTPRDGVYVGVVPFSSVVNVGGEANAKQWVGRWQNAWLNDASLPAIKKQRLESTNPDYVQDVWRGCIAEPRPWQAPDVNAVSARTPEAEFQPVFIRLNTPVTAKKNANNGTDGITIQISKAIADEEYYEYEDLIRLNRNPSASPAYDRRLWAEFGGDRAGNPKNNKADKDPAFEIYGAYEPKTCVSQLRTQFLTNDYATQVKPVLDGVRGISAVNRGKTLLPTGLLWSWRMLHDDWRGAKGWQGQVPTASQERRRVVVLFSGGRNEPWAELIESGKDADELWDSGAFNRFAFQFTYQAKGPKTYTQAPFELDLKNNADFWIQDIYQPGTSVAMIDPYTDGQSGTRALSFSGWPSVSSYASGICNAMKRDGIEIYVVDINADNAGSTSSMAASELLACSTDNRVYSPGSRADLNALRDLLLQNATETRRLRLIR